MPANTKDMIEAFLRRARKLQHLDQTSPDASTLALAADTALFKSVTSNSNYVLHQFLPPVRNMSLSF